MAKNAFQFQQFTVAQDRCAMKVGTDGTLLGAWALLPAQAEGAAAGQGRGPQRILDIGTGTGLIALMMAQRYPEALITAIDIDEHAVAQARQNAEASPFANRIQVLQADAATFDVDAPIDAIVSNPPYFIEALTCPDPLRTQARHADTLTLSTLTETARRLLTDDGCLSVIIPADSKSRLASEAALAGLFLTRQCFVRTTPAKPPKRCLLEYSKLPVKEVITSTEVLESSAGVRSSWYHRLTQDFYLR